nr:kinesin-like protein KIN-1 [Lolium perenne]
MLLPVTVLTLHLKFIFVQTGAGKTYSMEGPSILHCNELKTGLVLRVVNGLFDCLRTSENITTWTVKLSMVEIYLEKVR